MMWKVSKINYYYCCNSISVVAADKSVVVTDEDIGRIPLRTVLMKVDCVGTEDNIAECPQDNEHRCRNPGAGVICPFGNLLSIADYHVIM